VELEALQTVVADIEALGASLVVISPQLEKYSKQVAKKLGLTFSVLSDKGNRVAARFGLAFSLPDKLRDVYRSFGLDVERFNGDDAWTLPMPGRFIVDRRGQIVDANVHPDYTVRPQPSDIPKRLNHQGA
jgi:peroxiredoxin